MTDLKGNRIGGGLYRIIKDSCSFDESSRLPLTNVALNVQIADCLAVVEIRQTFNNSGEAGDVCAAFPLLATGGTQFSVTFRVNNVATSPSPMKSGASYLFTKSSEAAEQMYPKLYTGRIANVPAGKNVVAHITFTKKLVFRSNAARLFLPMTLMNIEEGLDSKLLKKLAKSWSAIVSCIVHVHMMSKIVSIHSSSDKIDASLSAAHPREAVVQFQRSNPVSPIELVISVADSCVPHLYFSPLELKPHEMQGLHHASVGLVSVTVPKLSLSNRQLPEVLFLLDVSESMKDGAFKFLSKSLLYMLKKLQDDVPFNVFAFGEGEPSVLWPKSQGHSKKTVAAATKWISALKPQAQRSDVLGALSVAMKLTAFDGFARQIVLLTDGLMNIGSDDLEVFLKAAKTKVARIFCVGFGAASARFCVRLAQVGRGICAIAEPWHTEKTFGAALKDVVAALMQPATVSTNFELKATTFGGEVLDRSVLDACYEGERLQLFFTLPPSPVAVEGRIGLYLGEGAVELELKADTVTTWDGQHPMAQVLQKLCAFEFMEELMQGRSFNNDRVARTKAQGDAFHIESRWTTSFVTPEDGNFYSTRAPFQVTHRGSLDKSDAAVGSKPMPPRFGSRPSASEMPTAVNPKTLMLRSGPAGTWPRPQPSMTPENVEKAKLMMKRMRESKTLILNSGNSMYKFEAQGHAIDMATECLSARLKVPPFHFSRGNQKLVQKVVSAALAKYETFFSSSLSAENVGVDVEAAVAPQDELKMIVRDTLEEMRVATGVTDRTASSDMELVCSSSIPVLVSCCGKIGGRPKGMEDRHTCIPNFYTLSRVGTMTQDAMFCAVYDGHAGGNCAEFCRLQLHVNLVAQYRIANDWEVALRAAFHETDKQFRAAAQMRRLKDGTTATVLLIEESTMYHANVGDGEGFLLWKTGKIEPVTHAHKSSDAGEVKRMREVEDRRGKKCVVDLGTGGIVVTDPLGNYVRVARSIGDPNFDEEVVTCDPAVGKITLTSDAELVVIASDGIWDVLTFQETAEVLHALGGSRQAKAAELLVDLAIERGSLDNCSAVVVFLHAAGGKIISSSSSVERH